MVQESAYKIIRCNGLESVHDINQRVAEELKRHGKVGRMDVLPNKSILAAGTHDPLLSARLTGEQKQMDRIAAGLSKRTYIMQGWF